MADCDDVYAKSLERDNEKLREQLASTQLALDVAEDRLRKAVAAGIDGPIYKPTENEIVQGYVLWDVSKGAVTDTMLFSCMKTTKSFFGRKKQRLFQFRLSVSPTANKRFSLNFHRYPDMKDLDFSDMSEWKELAQQMFEIARHHKFITIATLSSGGHMIEAYTESNGKKRFIRNGIMHEEA